MKIKKGDKILVTIGKDKGRNGIVEKVFTKEAKIMVAGINLYKKNTKKQDKKQGGIIDIAKPIPVANVLMVCPKCGKSTRVGYQINPDKTKNRICKKCKETI